GTTGYGFVNLVNGLFVDAGNAQAFTKLYQGWVGDTTPFSEVAYQKKFLILQVSLASELHTLGYQLDRLAQRNRWSRDFTLHTLPHALREVIACFPVYRSYISEDGPSETDRKYVLTAVKRARGKNAALSGAVFNFLRDVLLLEQPVGAPEGFREE